MAKQKKEKTLIIVESPTKARTISRFLSKDYIVESSFGHVRDLPKSKLGVDVENNFTPSYIIPTKAKKNVSNLKKIAKKVGFTFFATDEDREGEAIAWHLSQILKQPEDKTKRIAFHEITKEAIEDALAHPRDIDLNLVNAQQARRILDRLVGYKLSPLLWKKIARGLSAGRVQSVTLRLIIDRENEIKKFIPEEYWSIEALFKKENSEESFSAILYKIKDQLLDKMSLKSEEQTKKILENLNETNYIISDIQKKETRKNPPAPFTTSILQQEANKKLGFSSKKTMFVAQQLYEGIELGTEGEVGLITYMRTDSMNLADKFLDETQKFIKEKISSEYAPEQPRKFKTKSKLTQEAHEAIRPTSPWQAPQDIEKFLTEEQYKLYNLIWQRSIASQMTEAVINSKTIEIKNDKDCFFKAIGSTIKFDGFMKIYPTKMEENILPELLVNEKVKLENIDEKQHFTQPPARFSEASLIKTLEEYGIGRPSTYAPTISVIQNRNYVIKENNQFFPQEMGVLVNNLLVEHFPEIVDLEFTAKVENDLDEIADNKKEWEKVIKEFYDPFQKNLVEKEKSIVDKIQQNVESGELCEKCGKPMLIKMSRFGKFLACSGFPECRNIKSIKSSLGIKCPQCEKGQIIEKRTKKRKVFYACDNYPECKFALWQKPINKLCPQCGSLLVEGKDKPRTFSEQTAPFSAERDSEKVRGKINCSNKECNYTEERKIDSSKN